MNRSIVLFLVLLLALPGLYQCASVSKAPAEQSDAAKTLDAEEGRGVVFLYRPGKAIGSAVAVRVRVNSVEAGGTGPGTFFRWELEPGKYTFFSSSGESSATVELDVEAGKAYFIEQVTKIGLSDVRVTLKIKDEETGAKAVSGLKLAVSAYIPE